MMTRLKQERRPEDLDKEVMTHMRRRTRMRIHKLKRERPEGTYPPKESIDDILNHMMDVYEASLRVT